MSAVRVLGRVHQIQTRPTQLDTISEKVNGTSGSGHDPDNVKQKSVGGLLWLLSGNGAQAILQIGILAILARLIKPSEFGLLAAGRIVAEFGVKVGIAGIGRAIIQANDLSERYVATAFTVSSVVGVVIAALLFAGADTVAGLFGLQGLSPIIGALAFYVVIRALSLVSANLLERRLQFARLKAFQITGYLIGYGVVGISLAINQYEVWALVGAVLTEAAVTGILQFFAIRHRLVPWLDGRSLQKMARYAGGISLTSVSSFIALRADYFVVARWLGDTALGLYERSYKLIEGGLQLGGALDRVLFPAMSRMQEFPDRIRRAFGRSVAVMALVFLPFSAFLSLVAPEVVRLLLGENWSGAIPVFQVLAFGLYLRSGYKLAGGLARAKGFVYELALRQGIYALMVVVGAVVGAQAGVQEVAVAILAVLVLHYISMSSMGIRHADIEWKQFFRLHYYGVLLAMTVSAVTWLVVSSVRGMLAPDWVVLLAAVGGNTVVLLTAINVMPKQIVGENGIWLFETLNERLPISIVIRWL